MAIMKQQKDFIYSYAYYFSGSRENAEDLTQEVLIKIWQNLESVKNGPKRAWVAKVTRNLCIDWARSGKLKNRALVPLDERLPEPSVSARHVEQAVERRDLRKRIEAAIARLPEKLRGLIILREIQNLKYEEIAEALNMPLNTVKTNIHRGRRLLRELLSPVIEHTYQGRSMS